MWCRVSSFLQEDFFYDCLDEKHVYGFYFKSSFPLFPVLVFAEFSFTCIIDLTSALEYDGIISGFMEFYRRTVRFCHALTSRHGRVSFDCVTGLTEAFACAAGGAVPGNSVRHHDVLLGRSSTPDHVPADDQQDNRQVGHPFCSRRQKWKSAERSEETHWIIHLKANKTWCFI